MNHLTLDEIIDFVSLNELNEESMQLISMVTTHIAACDECRELVRAYQLVYDGLVHSDLGDDANVLSDGPMAAICAADPKDDLDG